MVPNLIQVLHAIVLPITMYRCESWAGKKADRKKVELLNYSAEGEYYAYREPPKRQITNKNGVNGLNIVKVIWSFKNLI